MKTVAAAILLLSAAASPWAATAGEPRAADAKALAACFGTNKEPAERYRCIGLVATPCLATPDGETTLGMATCYARERDAWDQILNRAYKAAETALDPAGNAYLHDAQTLWITFRDQSCHWPDHVYAGGSIVGPLTVECLRDETATRAITLTEIAESAQQR